MAAQRLKKRLLVAAKAVVGLLVIAALVRYAVGVSADLARRGGLPRVSLGWAAVAAALYVAGLWFDGLWFGRILDHSATPVPKSAALRAYVISHLGKYVPGKAMVVVLRVALVESAGARRATAALATFHETFVMMAAGGVVASAGFLLVPEARAVDLRFGPVGPVAVPVALLSLGLGLAFLAVSLPEVFGKLSRLASLPFSRVDSTAAPRFSYRLLGEGLLWTSAGWLFMGASHWAVLQALGWGALPANLVPAVLACVALATVAGFAVPVAPGGLGVREWVLWTSLGAVIDHDRAVLASLALRLCWVTAEILTAGVLGLWHDQRRRAGLQRAPKPGAAPRGAEPRL